MRWLQVLLFTICFPFTLSAFTTIVVDPGHGGWDRGGIPGQTISEKTMALDTGLRLAKALRTRGFNVIMTRTNDVFISLEQRCRISNRTRNSIFVSIHFDSYKRLGANGITTYYSKFNSGRLARYIQNQMLTALRPRTNRGVKLARFYVIRNTLAPSVLVEGGFLTNKEESRRIADPRYRQALAEAIAQGIANFNGW